MNRKVFIIFIFLLVLPGLLNSATMKIYTTAAQDGFVVESGEGTGVGGTAYDSNTEILVGDTDNTYIEDATVCGFAGVISILSGHGSTLVGVMVAAALLPPLIRSGLLLGGADYKNALNSFLIFSTNIVCLNIAGIITFYLAGIRPRRWWGKETAKKNPVCICNLDPDLDNFNHYHYAS